MFYFVYVTGVQIECFGTFNFPLFLDEFLFILYVVLAHLCHRSLKLLYSPIYSNIHIILGYGVKY